MRFTWALKHYPVTPIFKSLAEGLAILTPHALDAASHSEVSNSRSKWTYRRRIAQWASSAVPTPRRTASTTASVHPTMPHWSDVSKRCHRRDRRESRRRSARHRRRRFQRSTSTRRSCYALPGIEHITPPLTNPADAPNQLLDHVLLPPDATNVSVTVPAGGPEWAALSDHLPVTVRFRSRLGDGDFT